MTESLVITHIFHFDGPEVNRHLLSRISPEIYCWRRKEITAPVRDGRKILATAAGGENFSRAYGTPEFKKPQIPAMNCWAIFAPPLHGAKKIQKLGDDKIEIQGEIHLASFLTDH